MMILYIKFVKPVYSLFVCCCSYFLVKYIFSLLSQYTDPLKMRGTCRDRHRRNSKDAADMRQAGLTVDILFEI